MTTNNKQSSAESWTSLSRHNEFVNDEFLLGISSLTRQLVTEGKPLFNRTEPFVFKEWFQLFELTHEAFRHFNNVKVFSNLHVEVVRRGIISLVHWFEIDPQATMWVGGKRTQYHNWYTMLINELAADRFGIGSHFCKIDESRELIEMLVPIAQKRASIEILSELGWLRFPGDKKAREWFIKEHKNWT